MKTKPHYFSSGRLEFATIKPAKRQHCENVLFSSFQSMHMCIYIFFEGDDYSHTDCCLRHSRRLSDAASQQKITSLPAVDTWSVYYQEKICHFHI